MSLVRCKVLPQQGMCTMSILKTFLKMCPIRLKITNSTWFTLQILIYRSCQNSRYHICHILKYRLQRLYRYSLSARKWDENFDHLKWSISKESAWLKQTAMSFRSNVTRKTPRALPFVLHNRLLPARGSWRVNTAHVSSFVLISILRGQPRKPPSGDNLGVLDYHLKLIVSIHWDLNIRNEAEKESEHEQPAQKQ